MQSTQCGVYSAPGQPDIIVLYGGKQPGETKQAGPWVQWRFSWQPKNDRITTVYFEFKDMLAAGKYKLKEPREPGEMSFPGKW